MLFEFDGTGSCGRESAGGMGVGLAGWLFGWRRGSGPSSGSSLKIELCDKIDGALGGIRPCEREENPGFNQGYIDR